MFEFVCKENIDDLMFVFNVIRLYYVVLDGLVLYMCEVVDFMDDDVFVLYLKYYFVICECEDLVGVISYVIDIFRK